MHKFLSRHSHKISIFFALCLVALPPLVSAYHLLEPLPGVGEEIKGDVLGTYLSWLFRFALAAAAFLAVMQITIGGIQMIFGGASETARTNAKARIWDAIWGLVLALGSVLILITVSTQFENMKLTILPVTVTVTKETAAAYKCHAYNIIERGSWWYKPMEPGPLFEQEYKTLEECNKICNSTSLGTKYLTYACKPAAAEPAAKSVEEKAAELSESMRE